MSIFKGLSSKGKFGLGGAAVALALLVGSSLGGGGTAPAPSDPSAGITAETGAVSAGHVLAFDDDAEQPSADEQSAIKVEQNASKIPAGSSFSVRYFDVGQGDSILVECNGRYMLIDGGPPPASSMLYSYFKNNGISHLDYLVVSHSDTDHTGGISGALQLASVGRALSPVKSASERAFNAMVTLLSSKGVSLEVPRAGDEFMLGSAKVQVVGPVARASNDNDSSIVLRVAYGSTSFLFTGDAEVPSESAMLSSGRALRSDVLKVGHHGSDSSTGYVFLREVMPSHAIITVGKDNSYGHPTEAVLSRLRDAGSKVYRTDLQGDIVTKSDGTNITVTVSKNADANTLVPGGRAASTMGGSSGSNSAEVESTYIGNKRSKKFHKPTCRTLPAPQNQVPLNSREEAIGAGYSPCGNCRP